GIRWDMAGYGAYGATKQAIRALTRAAASEYGPDKIRVLTIAPHAESPGLKWWIENNPEEAQAFFRTIPLGRIGRLEEDIGRAIIALCGQDLSYLTGATVIVALWAGEQERETFNARLMAELPAALADAGASSIRLNLRDEAVRPAASLVQSWQTSQQDA
ncbi:hypothetical protein KXV85_003945, partial [Aspergillus fumigatus]